MRLTAVAIALTITCTLAAAPDEKTEQRVADSKSKKLKARGKGKAGVSSTTGERPRTETTMDRADEPQMPKDENLDPTRPGTRPTLPPNESAPKTPVKPPDPTAPSANP